MHQHSREQTFRPGQTRTTAVRVQVLPVFRSDDIPGRSQRATTGAPGRVPLSDYAADRSAAGSERDWAGGTIVEAGPVGAMGHADARKATMRRFMIVLIVGTIGIIVG